MLKKESSLFDFNDNSSNLQNTFDLRTFGPDFFNESINIVESMEKIPLSPLAKYGYVQGDNTFISRISNELGINAQSCLTTNGAGHALDLCLSVLVNDGCRILIPKPYFPAYPRLIRLNGGIPTFYSVEVCDNSIYENIKVELNKGTKVLIINNPWLTTTSLCVRTMQIQNEFPIFRSGTQLTQKLIIFTCSRRLLVRFWCRMLFFWCC